MVVVLYFDRFRYSTLSRLIRLVLRQHVSYQCAFLLEARRVKYWAEENCAPMRRPSNKQERDEWLN